MSLKSRAILPGLVAVGLLFAQSVSAIPFTVTAWAPAGGASVSISKTDPTAKNYNGAGGGFNMTNQTPGTVESFVSWCIDIFQFIPGGTGQFTLDAGGASLDPTTRNDLGRLATLALSAATTTGQSNNAAAFQLAVWEILYEAHTPGYSYNLGTGTFLSNLTSSAPHTIAQGWLSALNNDPGSASSYTMDVYRSDANQDQVTFKSVPEPAALGLLAFGLVGIGVVRRKSSAIQARNA